MSNDNSTSSSVCDDLNGYKTLLPNSSKYAVKCIMFSYNNIIVLIMVILPYNNCPS